MHNSGDTQEMIDLCLHCTRAKCVNCFDHQHKGGIPPTIDARTFKWEPVELPAEKVAGLGRMESAIYRMYQRGYSDAEMAELLHRTRSHISKTRKDMGLPSIRKNTAEALRIMREEGRL